MAQYLGRAMGIIFTSILLLAMVIPAKGGEVVATASIDSNEQLGEPELLCLLVLTIGAVLLAFGVWAENVLRPSNLPRSSSRNYQK